MPATPPSVKLSVIIVNYNVKYFLEQCLQSVLQASEGIATEIWVVDNNSQDGSVEMVQQRFLTVKVIANESNPGFSIANNQAIERSEAEYILLLNPDTIVAEDTFTKCLQFMDAHPQAGGLGIKMLDGSGQFLPESKRGFPTPFVAFCKTIGLSKLFPKSKKFNRYHLGFLSKEENHQIEVLAGAFMLMRTSVLDEVGLLDEQFFMYGEDIDLSYRIVQAGYENYYFAESQILHYKGESTKKGSLNYVRVFYQAMIIFAQKHFQGSKGRFFVGMLRLAIYFRAGLTLFSNLTKRGFQPILDLLLLYLGLFFLKDFWGIYHFNSSAYYGTQFLLVNAPLYTLIWLTSLYLNGVYDKGVTVKRIVRGILLGTLLIAAVYGFLDLAYRSSRMLILLGTIWGLFALTLVRYLGKWLGTNTFQTSSSTKSRLLIIGSKEESKRVQNLLGQVNIEKNLIGTIAPQSQEPDQDYIGSIQQIDRWIDLYQANEIIFCLKDVSTSILLETMDHLGPGISYFSVPIGSESIIGSSSKNTSGTLYTLEHQFELQEAFQKRNKRLFDFLSALLLCFLAPIYGLFIQQKGLYFRHLLETLIGRKTWVSYFPDEDAQLPNLKKGFIYPAVSEHELSAPTRKRLNFQYAKDYHWVKDLSLLWTFLVTIKK